VSAPPGSPVPSLPFISCIWCTRTPHFPSIASNALVAAPPPPRASPLYRLPYPLVYWPPAYSLALRASGDHLCYPPTTGDLDLTASIRFRPLPSYVAFVLVCTLLSLPYIPLLFTRRQAWPPCRPPTLVGVPSRSRA